MLRNAEDAPAQLFQPKVNLAVAFTVTGDLAFPEQSPWERTRKTTGGSPGGVAPLAGGKCHQAEGVIYLNNP
jgi:hypothetical protein